MRKSLHPITYKFIKLICRKKNAFQAMEKQNERKGPGLRSAILKWKGLEKDRNVPKLVFKTTPTPAIAENVKIIFGEDV